MPPGERSKEPSAKTWMLLYLAPGAGRAVDRDQVHGADVLQLTGWPPTPAAFSALRIASPASTSAGPVLGYHLEAQI